MRTTTLLARHSTLQQRLIARAHRRLASDAYRVANAFAFGVAATVSTAWALEGDVLVLGSSGHVLSRLLNKLGIITLPPNWCSEERQSSEQERFAGHADVVAEATAADGARVRVLCVWTEDTSGSYSEPPTPSRGYHVDARLQVLDGDREYMSAMARLSTSDGPDYVARVGDPPKYALALRASPAVAVDRDGRDGVRVRIDGASAIRCAREKLTEREFWAGLVGDLTAGAVASLVIGRATATLFRDWVAAARPELLLGARSVATGLATATYYGATAASCSAVLASVVAPAAWHWRHWLRIFDADERTYGDGDARWPNPSKSTLAHVQNHATMFVLFGTTFALWGGLFTAVLVFPIGGAAGLAFGVGRVRPVAIELARRGVTL
jgi:hypothetical protein